MSATGPRLSLKRRGLDAVRWLLARAMTDGFVARITAGASPTSLRARLARNPYAFKRGTFRRVCRYGLELELDASDLIDWFTFFGFANESHDALVRLVTPGTTIVDAGANFGLTTMRLALACGPAGLVYGIEPARLLFSRLEKHLELNRRLANIRPINCALGSSRAVGRMRTPVMANSGMTRLCLDASGEEVQIDALDVLLEHRTGPVALIKIDTEGSELAVLEGAATILRVDRPDLFVEIDDANLRAQGASASALFAFARSLGYTAYDIHGMRLDPSRMPEHFDAVFRI